MHTDTRLYSTLDTLNGYRFHVKHRRLGPLQSVSQTATGRQRSLRKGAGMSFSEVRQYQAGDDIRHIDWRVSARTQKTHTKLFSEEHEKPLIVIAEQTPALFFGSQVRLKANQVLNLAAILGWTSLQQNDPFGGLVFSPSHQAWVAPRHNDHALLGWLEQALQLQHTLSAPGPSNAWLWEQHCQQLLKVVKPGSRLFLIGDLLNATQATLNHLQSLRKHTQICVLQVYDPLEKSLPELGWLSLGEADSDATITLDTQDPQVQARYRKSYQTRWQTLQNRLHSLGICALEIGTQEDPLQALLAQRLIR